MKAIQVDQINFHGKDYKVIGSKVERIQGRFTKFVCIKFKRRYPTWVAYYPGM
jgi:hypothetical protein